MSIGVNQIANPNGIASHELLLKERGFGILKVQQAALRSSDILRIFYLYI